MPQFITVREMLDAVDTKKNDNYSALFAAVTIYNPSQKSLGPKGHFHVATVHLRFTLEL